MAAIKKQSLVDQIYRRLREDIIKQRLPLGSKLNVNELQSSLGVSCTPIREAVNRLQQEGLVIYENNVGARVLTLNEHDVMEIDELAITLHSAAIRLAMKRGDRAVIRRDFARYLADYEDAASPQQEVDAVHHMVGVFYHNCGNQRLDNSMIALHGQQLLLRHIYRSREGWEKNLENYRRMDRGIEAGDAEEICAALRENTERAEPVLLEYIRRKKEEA